MNECLMTPQYEKQFGYWVSEKGKLTKERHKKELRIYNIPECNFLTM